MRHTKKKDENDVWHEESRECMRLQSLSVSYFLFVRVSGSRMRMVLKDDRR